MDDSSGHFHASGCFDQFVANDAGLQLIGLADEVEVLEGAYRESVRTLQVVWISGNSGVGKSTLVQRVLLAKQNVCCGKFDKLERTPFAALIQVLSQLCGILLMQSAKLSLSPEDASVLCNVLPIAAQVLRGGTQRGSVGYKAAWGLERLKQAIRCFIVAAAQEFLSREEGAPLILVLDDLQWADVDSLGIITSLLEGSSARIEGLLFVGTYRSNDVVTGGDPLSHAISGSQSHPNLCVSCIELGPLDEQSTDQLIANVMKMPLCEAHGLGKLIFPKTSGNCLFILHMLHHIHDKNLLWFSILKSSWEWDEEKIRLQIDASENVVELLNQKMKAMPTTTKDALKLAACFGMRVDIELLEITVKKFAAFLSDLSSLRDALEVAVASNLIVVNADFTRLKFTHNKVATAAYDLIPSGHVRQSLHLDIGRHLLALSATPSLGEGHEAHNWKLMVIVDQFNLGRDLLEIDSERINLAELNSKAAEHAISSIHFKMANTFLNIGLEMLGSRRWESQYNLTLQLSNSLATVLFSNGLIEECLSIVREVYAKSRCKSDNYKAQIVHVESLACSGRLVECMDASFQIMKDLGHPKLPKIPRLRHVIFGMISVENLLSKLSDDELLNLPECTNSTKLAIMRQLAIIVPVAFFANQQLFIPILTCRMMQISLQDGLSEHSAYAFGSFAFSQTVRGNFEQAFRFANLALKLMRKFGNDARTLIMVHGLTYHVRNPIVDSNRHTLRAYHIAFSNGDLKFAGQACTLHCCAKIVAGLMLQNIAKDQRHFFNQLLAYNQKLMCNHILIWHRLVLKLLGRSGEMATFAAFTGGELSSDYEFEDYLRQSDADMALFLFWMVQVWYRFTLGDWDSALEFAQKCWKSKGLQGAFTYSVPYFLFSSLTALEAWKREKRRKHWRIFQKFHRELQKWMRKGNPNSIHLVMLLDAELLVVRKAKTAEVKRTFEKAITTARRGGFIQDAALANERIGSYFLTSDDNYWARHYLVAAKDLFDEWGAVAKVRQMTEHYGKLVEVAPDSRVRKSRNCSVKGRSNKIEIDLVEDMRNEPLLSMTSQEFELSAYHQEVDKKTNSCPFKG